MHFKSSVPDVDWCLDCLSGDCSCSSFSSDTFSLYTKLQNTSLTEIAKQEVSFLPKDIATDLSSWLTDATHNSHADRVSSWSSLLRMSLVTTSHLLSSLGDRCEPFSVQKISSKELNKPLRADAIPASLRVAAHITSTVSSCSRRGFFQLLSTAFFTSSKIWLVECFSLVVPNNGT